MEKSLSEATTPGQSGAIVMKRYFAFSKATALTEHPYQIA